MRIRTIKPEFWRHPVLGKLPDNTRLLALALLNYADDDGFFLADPALVRGECMPFEKDYRRITVSLHELSRSGWVSFSSETEMGVIGMVMNFHKHQVVNKPRKSTLKQYFDSGSPTGAIPETYLPEGKGRDKDKDKEGKGKEPAARLLTKFNELTGKEFRNGTQIAARLAEDGVTEDGIEKMMGRMVLLWKDDPKMSEYLRPETLFGKQKFDSYYAARLAPIANGKSLSRMEIDSTKNIKSIELE